MGGEYTAGMKKRTKTKFTRGKPTVRDLGLDAVQDKRLDSLCLKLRQLMGDEVKNKLEQGRLIYDEVSQFVEDERLRNKNVLRQFEIRPVQYGTQRIKNIANVLKRDERTIRNRIYFYRMVNFVGSYDKHLSPDHYIMLYEFRDKVGFVSSVDDAPNQKITAKNAKKVKELYAEAAAQGWSANHLFDHLEKELGKPLSHTAVVSDDEWVQRAKKFVQSAREAFTIGSEILAKAPDPSKIMVDTTQEVFYQLLQLFCQYRKLYEKKGLEFLDNQLKEEEDLKNKPLIRMDHAVYIGGKRNQLGFILSNIAKYAEWDSIKTACDVFAGRSHIAHAMKQMGWCVTANDKLRWAYYWAKWVVENDEIIFKDEDLKILLKPARKLNSKYNFITDKFFKTHRGILPKISKGNARIAQNYLTNLHLLPTKKRDFALCLLAVTIHEETPYSLETHGEPSANEYKLNEALWRRIQNANKYVIDGKGKCRATNCDAIKLLKKNKFDLLYFDPPYLVGRPLYESQLPESIAREKYVDLEFFKSPFMENKPKALQALDDLFAAADKSAKYWVVSYNSTSKINQWELGKIISKYRAQANLAITHKMVIGHLDRHSKQMTDEVLIICAPYPSSLKDSRIISKIDRSSADYKPGTWLEPCAFTEKSERSQIMPGKYTIRISIDKKTRNVSYSLLDNIGPVGHKVLNKILDKMGVNKNDAQASLPIQRRGLFRSLPEYFANQQKWAAEGNAQNQCLLGICYENGEGVKKDLIKAVEWYQKSAAQGEARAQFHLGKCYLLGDGVKKDLTKAIKWYQKALKRSTQTQKKAWNYLGRLLQV